VVKFVKLVKLGKNGENHKTGKIGQNFVVTVKQNFPKKNSIKNLTFFLQRYRVEYFEKIIIFFSGQQKKNVAILLIFSLKFYLHFPFSSMFEIYFFNNSNEKCVKS